MIVETILSTLDENSRPHFAPMGVVWGENELIVRPFRTTHTYRHLLATGHAVANITDDVLAFVESALGDVTLPHFQAKVVPGVVFSGACYWRELRVISAAGSPERAEVCCQVVHCGWQRDFLGFNRARAAIIEAAILATRLHLLDEAEVKAELDRYETIVLKTGDEPEYAALQRVRDYIRKWRHENSR